MILLAIAAPAAAQERTPPAEEPPAEEDYDVTVEGDRTRGPRADSPEAVEVIDTTEAREESVDMGALLNRTKGVTLRRSGGLGNPGLFYIHGLYGKRIRFFVDGVPADLTLLGISPADIPVHLLDHVELYKGVVPIRYGSDALGGAVNFVTQDFGAATFLETSTKLASFGTLRNSTVGRVLLEPELDLYVDLTAFVDRTDNNYNVDIETTDERGKLHPATVPRFHDGYAAYGASASLGVLNRSWADRLSVGLFFSDSDKDVQNNPRMTVPYGDITRGEEALGVNLHYTLRDKVGSPLGVDLLLSYADRDSYFFDISRNIWDWNGEVIGSRANPGERSRGSRVRSDTQRAVGRLNLAWRLDSHNRLEANTLASTSHEERETALTVAAGVEPTASTYELFKVASGVSWQLQLGDKRLESDLFAKHFYTRPDGPLSTDPSGENDVTVDRQAFGIGEGLRFSLIRDVLHVKASYEYAIRVPDPEELFGDGAFLAANTGLRNERSHNLNLGLALEPLELADFARVTANVNLFFRSTEDLIFLTVILDSARYENISNVDTKGVEAELSWTVLDLITVGGNVTWLDPTNESTDGYFGRFKDERIPNLPWLLGNLNASVNLRWPGSALDRVRIYWYGHYAHEFYLFWESEGIKSSKLKVPTYTTQDAGVSFRFAREWLVADVEVQNLTDEKTFDNVGVQLPGRTWNLKMSLALD